MGIPLLGFAPVERWSDPPKQLPNKFNEWIPEEFWPQSIYPEAKTHQYGKTGFLVSNQYVERLPIYLHHKKCKNHSLKK